jgi:cytidylate kinase
VAQRLGFDYLDTGAMYRVAALLAIRTGIDPADGGALALALAGRSVSAVSGRALLDSEDVSGEIRTHAVGEAASVASASSAVRARMVTLQREFGKGRSLVAEGRDMGTVVFPDAVLKVYVIADAAVRACRRMRQGGSPGRQPGLGEVVASMLRRDRRDRERADSPLRPAPGAFWLDTSLLSVEEQVDRVLALYRKAAGPGDA